MGSISCFFAYVVISYWRALCILPCWVLVIFVFFQTFLSLVLGHTKVTEKQFDSFEVCFKLCQVGQDQPLIQAQYLPLSSPPVLHVLQFSNFGSQEHKLFLALYELQGLCLLLIPGVFFLGFWQFTVMHALYSSEDCQAVSLVSFYVSLSSPCTLQYSVLQILVVLTSLKFQVCLLSSGRLLGSALVLH